MSATGATGRPRFLTDEDFEPAIIKGLRRRQPQLDLMTAVEASNLGKTDSEVLAFAAQESRILVSHDKRTLPGHFADYLAAGHHSPGVLLVSRKVSISQAIDALLLVWGASQHDEWADTITRLPF